MTYSIVLLFAIVAWSSTCIFAQTYKPVADKIIKEKLNLTMPEFIKECEKHHNLLKEEIKDRTYATKKAYALADKLVEKAKESPNVDDKTWDQLTKEHCLDEDHLQKVNASDVDDINKCLEEKQKLSGEKKTDFEHALFKAYCAEVERLAKEKYAANKN